MERFEVRELAMWSKIMDRGSQSFRSTVVQWRQGKLSVRKSCEASSQYPAASKPNANQI